jgi:cell division protein FtsL
VNTAAKAAFESHHEHESLLGGLFTRSHFTIVLLALMVFVSGFSVIYAKDWQRRLYIQSQNTTAQANQLQTEWGKLLLEQSTWSMQARVESIASHKLDMVMPAAKQIVMVQE